VEDQPVEVIKPAGHAQFERALDDRADERLKARVGVRDL
jgi:hypothetical protein